MWDFEYHENNLGCKAHVELDLKSPFEIRVWHIRRFERDFHADVEERSHEADGIQAKQ